MSIYVVRHGQTDWNVKGLYQGHTDIPLNSTGIMQASNLKENLKGIHFDIVFSSPLSRAYNTAKICLSTKTPSIVIDDSLIERSFGDLEGQSPSKFTDCNNDLLLDYSKNYSTHNVEPIQTVFRRVYHFLDHLLENYTHKNVLLVTHSAIVIAIECYFHGIPKDNKLINLAFDNCQYKSYNKRSPLYEKI